ncbi:MAG TPA: ATP-binding protein [Candidatus Nanoarchaeia archaeon]|nr:ATP-binding protein [Candidatus Nanoarchaeia archaeon]
MHKDDLIAVLHQWNFWGKNIDTGREREEYLRAIADLVKTGQIVTLIGPRRSGKSTLMLQFAQDLINCGTKPENTLYINFEDPRFSGELSLQFMQDAYETYLQYLHPQGPVYIFLDEIQLVEGWEKFVRSLHERKEATLIVSGSASQLLSHEFGTVLTGRQLPLHVFPLTFKEFMQFNDLACSTALDIAANKTRIKGLLLEYLRYGGFPQVVLSKQKEAILTQYFQDIIARDLVERHHIKNSSKVRELARYYLGNISAPCSFSKIRNYLKISLDSVERYSHYLEEAYMTLFVRKYAHSLKEQELSPRKVYCIDSGLRNMLAFTFSKDIGKLYENLVFLKLLQQKKEIFYSKQERECDFIVREKNKITCALQVCYDLDEHNEKRELEGLQQSMMRLKIPKGIVITEDLEKTQGPIEFIPLWKFLLDAESFTHQV